MPPILAVLLWFILLLALFHFDSTKDSKTSAAVWIPITWMFIISSRLPSQWLGTGGGPAIKAYEEGNPLDRTIFLILMVLAIGVLVARSFKWSRFFSRNLFLTAFLAYALLSLLWSDLPFLTFKKWFRDLGNYLVVLVVLSDPFPLEAIRMLLRRLSFLLIPLSIVVIKYYPQIGRQYSEWSGVANYSGVATTKDQLGAICLVSGLYFFWDTLVRWRDRREGKTKKRIAVNLALLAMTLWLLNMADSATCRVSFLLGCLVIVAARSKMVKRRPTLLKVLIPATVFLCLFLVFGADMKASIAEAVGRDATFTDRTLLWAYLLDMRINPLLGTGYESFWLGPRLAELWEKFAFRPNQAHDGYIELYLNLGIIGASLLIGFLIVSYRDICKGMGSGSELTPLSLALWAVTPIYNITTASFSKGELMWLTFLLVAISVCRPDKGQIPGAIGESEEERTHFRKLLSEVRTPARASPTRAGWR